MVLIIWRSFFLNFYPWFGLILTFDWKFDTIKINEKDSTLTELNVWHGKKNKVKVHINEDIYKTIPKAKKRYLKVKINYEGPIPAPIKKNQILGNLQVFFKDENIGTYDLLASENIKKTNIISRILNSINFLIWGDV